MATFKKKHGAYKQRGTAAEEARDARQNDALVETMVIAACIDGILSPGEGETLAALILDTPGFTELDDKGLAQTVAKVTQRIADDGIEARLKAISVKLGPKLQLREEAFKLATLFVHWDGEVGEEEQSFLEVLQRELGISDERASDIDAKLADQLEET